MSGIEENSSEYIAAIILELMGSKSIPYSRVLIDILIWSDPRIINNSEPLRTYFGCDESESGLMESKTVVERLERILLDLRRCGNGCSIELRVVSACHR